MKWSIQTVKKYLNIDYILKMNIALIFFIIAIVIILLFSKNIHETFFETYIPVNNPKQFLEECKTITKESNNIQNFLKSDGCTQDNITNLKMSNRDLINKQLSCKDLVTKEIVIGLDKSSWCDRVNQIDETQIIK